MKGTEWTVVRVRPETIQTARILAAMIGEALPDIFDEIVQVGVGYIYARRRNNLASPPEEIPEIWEKLPIAARIKSLKGTEMPPL